jgi:two-component system response regulator AtoC
MIPHAEEQRSNPCFVAQNAAMRKIYDQIDHVARTDVSVLCLGESGTGKEVVARRIHEMSPRARQPFLKVNCAALPGELLESELFGYEPGAFTGANRAKPGQFELCDRGTLMLDEVAEMAPALQAKLLHVLQDGEFSRLGGRVRKKVNVRIVAATNVDVTRAIASENFREDLYYRLSAFVFHLPPLRERPEDIPVLLREKMLRFSSEYRLEPIEFSPGLIDWCLRYDWPGNVRELENFVRRFVILRDEEQAVEDIGAASFPGRPSGSRTPAPTGKACFGREEDLKGLVRGLKAEAETEAIEGALHKTHWNRKQAAVLLGISYKALLYKLRQYGLDRDAATPRQVAPPADSRGKVMVLNRMAVKS